jgi:hypothetical protein
MNTLYPRGTKVILNIAGMLDEVFEILIYDDIHNKIFVKDARLPMLIDARRVIKVL